MLTPSNPKPDVRHKITAQALSNNPSNASSSVPLTQQSGKLKCPPRYPNLNKETHPGNHCLTQKHLTTSSRCFSHPLNMLLYGYWQRDGRVFFVGAMGMRRIWLVAITGVIWRKGGNGKDDLNEVVFERDVIWDFGTGGLGWGGEMPVVRSGWEVRAGGLSADQ